MGREMLNEWLEGGWCVFKWSGSGLLKWIHSLSGMNEEVQNIEARQEEGGSMPALPHSFLQARAGRTSPERHLSRDIYHLKMGNGQRFQVTPRCALKPHYSRCGSQTAEISGPTPELQNPHLHFIEIPRWSICTFERHCCRYYWGSLHRVHSSTVSYQNQVEGICSILDCICSIQFVKLTSDLLNGVMQFSTKGDTSINLPTWV